MYFRHEESTVTLDATAAEVFALLDDHRRLSSHMSKRSLMMGGGRMTTAMDAAGGRQVGSLIEVRGRVFGLLLWLKESVTERRPPTRKVWETVGEPRLLVIGRYRMGFDLMALSGTQLTVWIDYDLPPSGLPRLLGKMCARPYARWCVRRMTREASVTFSRAKPDTSVGASPTGVSVRAG